MKDTIETMNRTINQYYDPIYRRDDYIKHRELAVSIFGVNPTYRELVAVALYGKDAEILAK